MVLRWSRSNAVLGTALVFGLAPRARAQEPSPPTVAEAHREAHVDERANAHPSGGPVEDRAAEVQARADALRALLDGTLDPAVDAADLLVLRDDVFSIVIEAFDPPLPDSSPETGTAADRPANAP